VTASLIGLFFGLLWLFVGASAISGPLAIAVGAGGGALFAGAAWRVIRGGGRGRSGGRFDRRYYIAAVAAEVLAIIVAQSWLAAHGQSALLLPVVGVIVGLHFIGLWLAMGVQRFLWLTGALVGLNLAALLLPLSPPGRVILSGLGSSFALLVAVAA
jgi:hypothetical protein